MQNVFKTLQQNHKNWAGTAPLGIIYSRMHTAQRQPRCGRTRSTTGRCFGHRPLGCWAAVVCAWLIMSRNRGKKTKYDIWVDWCWMVGSREVLLWPWRWHFGRVCKDCRAFRPRTKLQPLTLLRICHNGTRTCMRRKRRLRWSWIYGFWPSDDIHRGVGRWFPDRMCPWCLPHWRKMSQMPLSCPLLVSDEVNLSATSWCFSTVCWPVPEK